MEYNLDDNHGHRNHEQNPYQELNNGWFAASRDHYGQITSVHYDLDHFTHNSLNVKKIMASMISMYVLAHESDYDHEETDSSGGYLAHYTRSNNRTSLIYHAVGTVSDQNLVKRLQKVIEFGQDGNLKSVKMTEDVTGDSDLGEEGHGFFALSVVHSESVLKYFSKLPSNSNPITPQHITNDTLGIVHSTVYDQFTQNVKRQIKSTILSCVKVSDRKCIEELKLLLQHVSSKELKLFVEDYISTNTDSPKQLFVLLQALCSSQRKGVGFVISDDVLSKLSTDIICHSLPCLSASEPTDGVLNMLHYLAFNDRSATDVDLTNRATLLLGVVAKKLETTDSSTSSEIVERLHNELNKHTSK